jgi:hypothetical protein
MKTSKKILVATAGLIIVFFVISIIILRNGVYSLQQKAELKHKYSIVSADEFEKLDFSSHWIVKIRQGKDCHVESTADVNSFLKPTIENINGTLYFKVDTTAPRENADSIFVKITLPSLKAIKAVRGADIYIENFQADSLHVILENGCVFSGMNNNIKYVTIETSGENLLNITKIF